MTSCSPFVVRPPDSSKENKSPGLRRLVGALTSFRQPAQDGKGKGRAKYKVQAGRGFSIIRGARASGKWIDRIDLFESREKKKAAGVSRRPEEIECGV
jgi:hypothetical protein